MTVLVTGGAGYIGSHTVHELTDQGEPVIVLDNLSTGFRFALPKSVPLIVGEASDQVLVNHLIQRHKVDSIIHFAGSIVVPESVADPLGYYLNNTVTSRALIEVAVKSGVKNFVFSSTAAVYGDQDTSPVPEDAPKDPLSPYGSSKLMTEVMLRDVSRAHDLKHVILRYFNVAGGDPKLRTGQSTPAATHLIKLASQAAIGLRPALSVFGTDYPTPDGTCIRDYIHVTDLARAHHAAIRHLRAGGPSNTFNCGYGRGSSVLEVIEAIRRVSGLSLDVNFAPRRAGDAASLVADVTRIRGALDWEPEYDNLDTIVAHALAWEIRLAADPDHPVREEPDATPAAAVA
jgi:UDP-glucose 4-epimerase